MKKILLFFGLGVSASSMVCQAYDELDIKGRSEVRACEKMVTQACEQGEKLAVYARQALSMGGLPASLRSAIMQHIDTLQNVREIVFCIARRGDPHYYASVCASMEANFEGVSVVGKSFDPKKVYETLNYDPKVGIGLSAEFFKLRIDAERNNPDCSYERQRVLRQIRYVFANQYAKQEYDAYLQGKRAVDDLRISSSQADRLVALIEKVLILKASLSEFMREK